MKKILAITCIGMLALVSCEKDYSCTCTETYTDGTDTYTDSYTYRVEGATKKQAEIACNEATISQTEGTQTYEMTCVLTK